MEMVHEGTDNKDKLIKIIEQIDDDKQIAYILEFIILKFGLE